MPPSRRTPSRRSPSAQMTSADPNSAFTRNPSTARRRMLATLKITSQSPAVYGPTRRKISDAAAERSSRSREDFIRPECNPGKQALCVQKRQRRLREQRRSIEEDGSMTAIRHDPERGLRNRTIHLDRGLHRVERIAVTIDDQRARSNGAQIGSRELHVVVAVFERAGPCPQEANLIVA